MRKTGWVVLCLMLLGSLLLTGCKNSVQGGVSVQSVSMITGFEAAGAIDRYAGVVEAGETVNIEKKQEMEIAEVLVKAGEDVTEGQTLFIYNTDAISLGLEKLKLELEQMKNSILTKTAQMEQLKKEQASAGSAQQLDYTIQIQELQVDISETTYNISTKEKDIEQTQSILENAEVTSPVNGSVQAINETGTDDYGNPLPYMTIAQTGAYRIKGTVNEQNREQLYEGALVLVRSRIDDTMLWHGTISFIDWDSPIGNNGNDFMVYSGIKSDSSDTGASSTSSNYPFYVTLDSEEGLMLGQHVYIEADYGQLAPEGIVLSASYIQDAEGSPWVWAASRNSRLEKRSITLGEYQAETESYTVTGGLAMTDYIAFPDSRCIEGVEVTYYDEESFGSEEETKNPEENPEQGGDFENIGGEQGEPIVDEVEPAVGGEDIIVDSGNGGDVG